ncbi:cotton fiber protein [Parasponia andersonii]|uniref:Cotton fiber protein n=1 Tax=Parasponia andersonii TaxID=3476 RepID=A0A2P5A3T9_PARAD|nr:cotton fiber protein [Parasponia andersonii]
MSRWSLGKKLSPAKKAWKSFATRLQPRMIKLIKHSIPEAIKTTSRRLLYCLQSFFPTKLRTISNPFNSSSRRRQSTYYYNNHTSRPIYKSLAAIHIDELFASTAEPVVFSASTTTKNTHNKSNIVRFNNKNMHADQAGTSGNKEDYKGKQVAEDDHGGKDLKRISSKSIYSVEDAWKVVVASSPQLRGVDERAEEFISNFRQDMKLQKEKSILEFQEMLIRSA